jgi:hypothetical protein
MSKEVGGLFPKRGQKMAKEDLSCLNGKLLVAFGASVVLTHEEIASLEEMATWPDQALGRMVKHQIEKRLRVHEVDSDRSAQPAFPEVLRYGM